MVFCLALYLFLLTTAFAETDTVSRDVQPQNNVKLTPAISATDKPSLQNAQRMGYVMPGNTIQDPRCPYAGILLQLLSMLLEFLQHSSESEKVNKVITVMKSYLQNAPLGSDKDELFMKLKLIEEQLHKNGPLHDYFTTGTQNGKSATTIVFKTEVPNLEQPKCKTEFARLIQAAYNNYIGLANYPNCQQNNFPAFDKAPSPGQQQVPFEISFNNPQPNTQIHNPNIDGSPLYNYPQNPNTFPLFNTPSTKPNIFNPNLPITNNKNPFNLIPNPITSKPSDNIWPILNNNNPQYSDMINKLFKDHPELLHDLDPPQNGLPNGNSINGIGGNQNAEIPNSIDIKTIIPSLYNYNPDDLMPTIQPSNPITNNNLTSPPFYFDFNEPNPIKTPELNEIINPKPKPHGDDIMDLLSPEGIPKPSNNPTNNDIDYSVLLGQLGLSNPPKNNPYYNQGTPGQIYPSGHGQNNNGMYPLHPEVNQNENGNYITLNNPFQGYHNPNLNNFNGIPNNANQYPQETILDKKRIPIQLDRFTLNHDRIPYILEYIATSKNPANYINNLVNHYLKNVGDNTVSPDLSAFGVTNPAKLVNKAGIIELTYVLKRPQPLVYHPVYYVKYRLPYTKFVQNYRNLILQKPVLRSEPAKIYKELISLSNITEVSPDLKGYDKEDIINLMVKDGTLLTAKLINGKDDALNEQLELIQDLNSNSTPADINRLTNATISNSNILDDKKRIDTEKVNPIPGQLPVAVAEDITNIRNYDSFNPYNSNPILTPNTIDNNPFTNPNNIIDTKQPIPVGNIPYAPTNVLEKDKLTNPLLNNNPFNNPNINTYNPINNQAFNNNPSPITNNASPITNNPFNNQASNNNPNPITNNSITSPKADVNNSLNSLNNSNIQSLIAALLKNNQKVNPGFGNYRPNSRKRRDIQS